eukprot:gene39314-47851_t
MTESVEVSYVGDRNDKGQKHGRGKTVFGNNEIYEGEYFEDKRHGYGKYTYDNGEVYDGQWKDGKKHGKG